jgi:hypothetical protein
LLEDLEREHLGLHQRQALSRPLRTKYGAVGATHLVPLVLELLLGALGA